MSLQGADQLHYRIHAQSHRIQVENVRELLRVYFIQTFLKHLRFL